MASNNYWASGQWNFICELCGEQRKSKDGVKTWDGHYVCRHHKEVRNPQDFVRGVRENLTVPWTRPPTDDQFVAIEYDRSFSDEADITEGLSFNLSRIIGFTPISSDGLNGNALNSSAMNSTSPSDVNYEQALLTESVVLGAAESFFADSTTSAESTALTYGKALTDSALGTESIALATSKAFVDSTTSAESVVLTTAKVFAEGITTSETVRFNFNSPTSLNGSTLNTLALG